MTKQFDVWHTTLKDATGNLKVGWWIFEDGRPAGRYESQQEAAKHANALACIRGCQDAKILVHAVDLTQLSAPNPPQR